MAGTTSIWRGSRRNPTKLEKGVTAALRGDSIDPDRSSMKAISVPGGVFGFVLMRKPLHEGWDSCGGERVDFGKKGIR